MVDLKKENTDLKQARVHHKPRLLSDNGPCYISGELKRWLGEQQIEYTRGAPYHPMTQGKIERYHRSMKNVVKLENYYYPWELELAIGDWVQHYNHEPEKGTKPEISRIDWSNNEQKSVS